MVLVVMVLLPVLLLWAKTRAFPATQLNCVFSLKESLSCSASPTEL